MDLVNNVYSMLNQFPKNEEYALSSQIRRAVVSIPSNIAEGQGRNSNKEFVQFLYIANGSLFELETQISIAINQKYISEEQAAPIIDQCMEIGKMLINLIKSISN